MSPDRDFHLSEQLSPEVTYRSSSDGSEAVRSSSADQSAKTDRWLPKDYRQKLSELERVRGPETKQIPLQWRVYALQSVSPTALRTTILLDKCKLSSAQFVSLYPLAFMSKFELEQGESVDLLIDEEVEQSVAIAAAEAEIKGSLDKCLLDRRIHPLAYRYTDLEDELGLAYQRSLAQKLSQDPSSELLDIPVTALLTLSPFHTPSDEQHRYNRSITLDQINELISPDVKEVWQAYEYKKRLAVLNVIAKLFPHRMNDAQRSQLDTLDPNDYGAIAELSEEVDASGISGQEIVTALEYANLLEEFRLPEFQEVIKRNPSLFHLRLLAVLPEFSEEVAARLDALGLLEAAVFIRKFEVRIAEQLTLSVAELREGELVTLPIIEAQQRPKQVKDLHVNTEGFIDQDEQLARAVLEKNFGIPAADFETVARRYGEDTDHHTSVIGRQFLRNPIVENLRSQDNDVNNATAVELLQYALWQGESVQRYSESQRKKIQTEARRKLVVMREIVAADRSYDQRYQKGRGPFQQMWKRLLEPSNRATYVEIRDSRTNRLLGVELADDETGERFSTTKRIQHQTRVRVLHLPDGSEVVVQHDERTKSKHSYRRKWLSGDKNQTDLFASEIAVCLPPDHPLMKLEERLLTIGPAPAPGKEPPKKVVTDHRVVFETIEALRQDVLAHVGPGGWEFWVSKYSQTSEGPNGQSKGKGPGSKNDLRYAKFAIHIRGTNALGFRESYIEEIQMPTSNVEGSALFHLARKKADHPDYEARRLLAPLPFLSHLSIEELYYSRLVYGELE